MKKKLKYFLIIFIILNLLLFISDIINVQRQTSPLKILNISGYNDGGTEEYLRLGYKIIDFRCMISTKEKIYIAHYVYMCPWFTSYNEAWNSVKDKITLY